MVPRYVLVGARRLSGLLETSSVASAMAILTSHSDFADLTHSNYLEALEWLEQNGLKDVPNCSASETAQRAFEVVLQNGDASWLSNGMDDLPTPEFLPQPILDAAFALELDPMVALQLSLKYGHQVDLARRERIGLLGELALVSYLEQQGAAVIHESLVSDTLGWDIRCSLQGQEWHIELKSTISLSRLRLFLSRNEYEVSLRDPRWLLAVALINEHGDLFRIAHIRRGTLPHLVPIDRASGCRWQSCSIDCLPEIVIPGLPAELQESGIDSIILSGDHPSWWPLAQSVP